VIANLHASGGGGERFVRELAAGLAATAPETAFTLVAVTTPGTAFSLGRDDLEERGVEVVPASPDRLYATLEEQAAGADLVHVAWPHLAEVPEVAAPLVCTFHDANWRHFDTYSAAQKEAADRQTAAWVQRTDRFVCSSQFIRGELTRLFGARPDGVAVVPLTAEADPRPVTDAERDEVTARYALPRTFVLSPHGNHVHKNYPVLAGALDDLRAAGRPVTVVATGAGTAAFQGPDLLGLGYVTGRELTVLYDLAAGMVQTTLYEAGSFPMWEAMLAGIPVACSAIPPLLEQLERQATTAETFDPGDRAAVAAALARLVDEPRDADAAARNRQIVGQRTFSDVAAGYLDVFRAVAGAELR
jgi:glycosyltransferase involved in cell wall biosynthesis